MKLQGYEGYLTNKSTAISIAKRTLTDQNVSSWERFILIHLFPHPNDRLKALRFAE